MTPAGVECTHQNTHSFSALQVELSEVQGSENALEEVLFVEPMVSSATIKSANHMQQLQL